MAGNNQYKAKQFIDAIPGTGGVISVIAARVGCAWNTAKKYIDEKPTILQAYKNEKRQVDDKAVSNIFEAISNGDLETSKWWVRMKMSDEFAPAEKRIIKDEVIVEWDEPIQD